MIKLRKAKCNKKKNKFYIDTDIGLGKEEIKEKIKKENKDLENFFDKYREVIELKKKKIHIDRTCNCCGNIIEGNTLFYRGKKKGKIVANICTDCVHKIDLDKYRIID